MTTVCWHAAVFVAVRKWNALTWKPYWIGVVDAYLPQEDYVQ